MRKKHPVWHQRLSLEHGTLCCWEKKFSRWFGWYWQNLINWLSLTCEKCKLVNENRKIIIMEKSCKNRFFVLLIDFDMVLFYQWLAANVRKQKIMRRAISIKWKNKSTTTTRGWTQHHSNPQTTPIMYFEVSSNSKGFY